jgi:polar amino acid transport system substrate-binding protein
LKYLLQFGLALGLMCSALNVAARTPDVIKQSGELIVARRNHLPPMSFLKNNELVGIDIELAKRLAKSLDVKVKWYPFTNLGDREKLLVNQTVDVVISSYSITEERLNIVSFSDSYLDSGSALLIRQAQANQIKSYKDLVNKAVAVVKKSTSEATLTSIFADKIKLVPVEKINEAYPLLETNKVDAVVYDKTMLDYYAAQHADVLVVKEDPIDPNQYAIGLNQQDKALLVYINNWLKDLKHSAELDKILKHYATNSLNLDKKPVLGTAENYTIKSGDTLSSIAKEVYADASQWVLIYQANREIIQYPNIIPARRIIKIPSSGKSKPKSIKGNCDEKLKKLNTYKENLEKEVFQQKQKEILDKCL